MSDYHTLIYDDKGTPLAAVDVTALTEGGDEIVEKVREAVEPEADE